MENEDCTCSTNNYVPSSNIMIGTPVPNNTPCPSCGYCQHCGRRNGYVAPYPWAGPWYQPYSPYIWCGTTGSNISINSVVYDGA